MEGQRYIKNMIQARKCENYQEVMNSYENDLCEALSIYMNMSLNKGLNIIQLICLLVEFDPFSFI